mmetsp:Transcript_9632/g.29257  ORF Transcript_9632/g.29257 Transcript_9632/m.29257 type:complete len:433 (-) Transcript_9632:169-1467(-)
MDSEAVSPMQVLTTKLLDQALGLGAVLPADVRLVDSEHDSREAPERSQDDHAVRELGLGQDVGRFEFKAKPIVVAEHLDRGRSVRGGLRVQIQRDVEALSHGRHVRPEDRLVSSTVVPVENALGPVQPVTHNVGIVLPGRRHVIEPIREGVLAEGGVERSEKRLAVTTVIAILSVASVHQLRGDGAVVVSREQSDFDGVRADCPQLREHRIRRRKRADVVRRSHLANEAGGHDAPVRRVRCRDVDEGVPRAFVPFLRRAEPVRDHHLSSCVDRRGDRHGRGRLVRLAVRVFAHGHVDDDVVVTKRRRCLVVNFRGERLRRRQQSRDLSGEGWVRPVEIRRVELEPRGALDAKVEPQGSLARERDGDVGRVRSERLGVPKAGIVVRGDGHRAQRVRLQWSNRGALGRRRHVVEEEGGEGVRGEPRTVIAKASL